MEAKGRRDILTAPNLISLFRLLLIPLMAGLYLRAKTVAALVVFGVSALSDVADGRIARRFGMVTDLGKMLDPLADKLTQGAAALLVGTVHPQLFFLFGSMAVKEIAQAAIGAYSVRHTGQVLSALWFGKVCTVVTTGFLMVLFAFPRLPETAISAMVLLCIALMLLSLILYAQRWHALNAAARREGRALS